MILVDSALAARATAGRPIELALIGAGFMGQGLVNQIENSVPGLHVGAIVNRHPQRAIDALRYAGVTEWVDAETSVDVDRAIDHGTTAVTDDPGIVCKSEAIDAVLEVTGTVRYAAGVVLDAIESGKHAILMNAELDATLGPILKVRADRAGVVYTGCDGDQPGVQVNLFRFVRSIGCRPLLCGNVKGLHDPYRNPTTQEGFARRWGQNPTMVTSFADGTKISFEQAIVANATQMTVLQRGMTGRTHEGHVDELTSCFDADELRTLGGVVDYVVGATPSPGVFVLAEHDDPRQRHYLELYKLGTGPLYSFYTPYHLCHFEAPLSVVRAVDFGDAVLAPAGAPRVEVITAAKTDLRAGEILDGIGGYSTYGLCEDATVARHLRLLPMGLAEGSRLRRDVSRDEVLSYDDVEPPPETLADLLRREQTVHFGLEVSSP